VIFLRGLLLWGIISVHVVGAAFLFRRLFPGESRWLAFIVPGVVAVLFCNFIEHTIALTFLGALLPFTAGGSIWAMVAPKSPWRVMRLPSLLFVSAFAFNVVLRALLPNIATSSDGISDLGIVSDFLFGQTLPPDSSWGPPVKLLYYYYLEHYGASLLIRVLGVDPGTGFNLSVALLSAYFYFMAGAAGWLIGRGRLWIALLMPLLTACAATGTSGYLWLTISGVTWENVINLHSALGDSGADHNWLLRQLTTIYCSDQPVLTPPGFGGWTGSLHSVQAGQCVIGLALLSTLELLRRRRGNWPWISLLISPFLMMTTCTWNVPMLGIIILAVLVIAHFQKLRPASHGFVLVVAGGLIAFLEPMLADVLNWEPVGGFGLVDGNLRTQGLEFASQWWPVGLPWIALFSIWKRLSAVTRILLILAPLTCVVVEIVGFGWRGDMTAKIWGCVFSACWMIFLPEVARQRAWPFRVILALVVAACLLSLCYWVTSDWRSLNWDEVGRLDGRGLFRSDERKARIVASLSKLDGQIIIPSLTDGIDQGAALLMPFSHTRAYATWSLVTDVIFYTNGMGEAGRRRVNVNRLYTGKLADPLTFLRQGNIAGVVIYPDDSIDLAVLAQLKQKLAPYYTYEDGWNRSDEQVGKDESPTTPCAGVFVYHPEVTALLGAPKTLTVDKDGSVPLK
jgi:hypothetical protein